MASTLMEAAPSSRRRGRGLLRTAGALVGGLGLAGVAAGGAALAWGSVERTMPVLRRYEVPVRARVPEVTILQIADLHLFAGQEFLLRFLSDVASSERFDMVVATGDNFGSTQALDMVMDAYRPFLSYPGAFVLGSNDYYSPIPKRWSRYLSRSKPHPARVVPDLPYLPMVRELVRAGWLDCLTPPGPSPFPVGRCHCWEPTTRIFTVTAWGLRPRRGGRPASCTWASRTRRTRASCRRSPRLART